MSALLDLLGEAVEAVLALADRSKPLAEEKRWVRRLRIGSWIFAGLCAATLPAMIVLHLLGVL